MIFNKTIALKKAHEKVGTFDEGVGLLRAIVVGSAFFVMLSVPLTLNVQAKKYTSQTIDMRLKMKVDKERTATLESSINAQLEMFFPKAEVVHANGKRFYVRSK